MCLLHCAESGDVEKLACVLQSVQADINAKESDNASSFYGTSPLWVASCKGHREVVKLLLSKGASVHDKDNHGNSPILAATFRGHMNVVDLLLSKGASLHDISTSGYTCFFSARDFLYNRHPYRKHGLLYRLHKWPTTMAILVMTELALYHQVETDSLVDLHHFLGIPDDEDGGSYVLDSEEMYTPALHEGRRMKDEE